MKNKKSTYRALAEGLVFERLQDIEVNLDHLDKRKMSISEMKQHIREAFKDAKAAAEVEATEVARGWGDAELENEINWVKTLNLKEFFQPKRDAAPVQEEYESDDDDDDDMKDGEKYHEDMKYDDDDDDMKDGEKYHEDMKYDDDDDDDTPEEGSY